MSKDKEYLLKKWNDILEETVCVHGIHPLMAITSGHYKTTTCFCQSSGPLQRKILRTRLSELLEDD